MNHCAIYHHTLTPRDNTIHETTCSNQTVEMFLACCYSLNVSDGAFTVLCCDLTHHLLTAVCKYFTHSKENSPFVLECICTSNINNLRGIRFFTRFNFKPRLLLQNI